MPTETHRPVAGDPDAGLPDLVRSLASDAKHLASSEVRLARLEIRESVREGGRGALWMGIGFGIAIIALIGLTIAFVAAVAALAGGNLWAGALIVGGAELAGALALVRWGFGKFDGDSDDDDEPERKQAP